MPFTALLDTGDPVSIDNMTAPEQQTITVEEQMIAAKKRRTAAE